MIPRRPWVFVMSETWASSNAADIGVAVVVAMTDPVVGSVCGPPACDGQGVDVTNTPSPKITI